MSRKSELTRPRPSARAGWLWGLAASLVVAAAVLCLILRSSDSRAALHSPASSSSASVATRSLQPPAAPAESALPAPSAAPEPARLAVRGRALDLRGRPVAGLALRVASGGSAVSDADGSFRIRTASREERVCVDTPGMCVLASSTAREQRAGAPLVLIVEPGGRLDGTVADERGVALGGAEILVRVDANALSDLPLALERVSSLSWSTVSSPEGVFELFDVPLSISGELCVARRGYLPQALELSALGGRVQVVLERAALLPRRVAGLVLSAGGEPVGEAQVFLGRARTQTDERGRFELAVPSGEPLAQLAAFKPGVGTAAPRALPAAKLDAVPDAGPAWVELVLDGREARFAGTLLQADGTPAAGWLVSCLETSADGAPRDGLAGPQRSLFACITDGAGAFDVRGRAALDGPVRLKAWNKALGTTALSEPMAPTDELVWSLPEAAPRELLGRVLAAAGDGVVAGARVSIAPLFAVEGGPWVGHVADTTCSTDDGLFLASRCPPGPVRLHVFKPGFASAVLDVDPRSDVLPTVLLARTCEARLTLEGELPDACSIELRDASGAPVALALASREGRARTRLALDSALRSRLVASELGTVLVVLDGERELFQRPVRLRPGELTVIRL